MQKISVLLSSLSGKTKAFFVSSSTKQLHRKPLGNSKVFVNDMLSFKNEAQTNNKNFRIMFLDLNESHMPKIS